MYSIAFVLRPFESLFLSFDDLIRSIVPILYWAATPSMVIFTEKGFLPAMSTKYEKPRKSHPDPQSFSVIGLNFPMMKPALFSYFS